MAETIRHDEVSTYYFVYQLNLDASAVHMHTDVKYPVFLRDMRTAEFLTEPGPTGPSPILTESI